MACLLLAAVPPPVADSTQGGAGWRTIGHSVQDRPIKVLRTGDRAAPFKALVVGSIHGDEPQGIRVVDRLRNAHRRPPAGVEMWTIATVNPDGTRAGTRKNARGVDLNRNFPYRFDPTLNDGYESGPRPASEPETRAVIRMARRTRFDLAIWYHQPWGETLVPCGPNAKHARRYARLSGLRPSRGCERPLPGSAMNWMAARLGAKAFVVELPDRSLARGEVRRHARAVVRLARRLARPS